LRRARGGALSLSGEASCRVRVPVTTANLGPGFDCLGLALDLWNETAFTLAGEGISVVSSGEGSEELASSSKNLIARAYLRCCDEVGAPYPPGLRIACEARIPLASGLGSSSSAVVAGLLGANTLLGRPFDRAQLLELAADMEGHPDNVAAAMLGGLTIVVRKGSRLLTKKIVVPEVHVALAVPDIRVSTQAARSELPAEVPMQDAVFNLGRTPLVVEALRTGDYGLLGQAMEDRLHQESRLELIPGARAAWLAAQRAGAAAVAVSGSGPSLVAFVSLSTDALRVARAMVDAFVAEGVAARPLALAASAAGATVSV
jgi:homoserine kinase